MILKWFKPLDKFLAFCICKLRPDDKWLHLSHKEDIWRDNSNPRRRNMQHLWGVKEDWNMIEFWVHKFSYDSIDITGCFSKHNVTWTYPFLEFFALQKLFDCKLFVVFFIECHRVWWNEFHSTLNGLIHDSIYCFHFFVY